MGKLDASPRKVNEAATRPLIRLAELLRQGQHKNAARSQSRFPYGLWIFPDGRQVLFDAAYDPLWRRARNGTIARADLADFRHGPGIQEEIFFSKDRTPFYCQYEGMKRLRAVLRSWGVIQSSQKERARRYYLDFVAHLHRDELETE